MKYLIVFVLVFQSIMYGQQEDFHPIDFKEADSIAHQLQGASLKNLPLLTYRLTKNLSTDVEKFRAIYIWICNNIENDYTSYLRTKNKRKKIKKDENLFLAWNKSYTPKMFRRMVSDKKTACTGYAYLVKEMANLTGLNCEIVNGFGRVLNANLTENSVPNHSWNAVQLNTKWYLCDATWSAGTFIINEDIPEFKKDYVDGYFLTPPEHFVKNHYPVDKKWLLSEEHIDFKTFLTAPLLYKDAFQLGVFPKEPKQMHVSVIRDNPFELKMIGPPGLDTQMVHFKVTHGNTTENISPAFEKTKDGYILKHIFRKKGNYDLHLSIGEKPIATYVIKVTK